MKLVAPLSISIRPSRRLLLIQSLAHIAAAASVLAATLPSWLTGVLLILTGASLAHQRRPLTVAALLLNGDGGLKTVGADGTAVEAVVQPHTFVLSFLVVLVFRQEGHLRFLTLLADSLATEDFRQLRLWLRWRSAAAHPV